MQYFENIREHNSLFSVVKHTKELKNDFACKLEIHIQPTIEMVYVSDGRFDLHINGCIETIHTGEIGIVFPFQPHEYSREKGTEYFRFHFSTFLAKSFFKSTENNVGESAVFKPDMTDTAPFINKLKNNQRPPIYKVKGFLYSILSDFLSQITLSVKSADEDILNRAIFYMDKHKKEQILASEVAASIGYHEKYLSRCINKMLNVSFTTLLCTLRMDDAKSMLIETDKTMLEIAMDCGFGSERTFYRHFKNLTGMSPKEYRKQNIHPAKNYDNVLV